VRRVGRVAALVEELVPVLTAATPGKLPGLSEQEVEIWQPLWAIADAAGGHWPEIARDAARELHREVEDGDVGITLLEDIRTILGEKQWSAVSSRELCDALNEIVARP